MSARPVSARRAGLYLSGRQVASRERLFLAVAHELAARGWSVEILAAGPERALREQVEAPLGLVDVSPLWGRLPGLRPPHLVRVAASTRGVAGWLRSRRPDVLLATSIPPNLAALVGARRTGVPAPLVLRQSNVLRIAGHERYGGVRRRWRDPLIPRLYPDAARVIAVAEGVADNLVALGAADPDRITVIPNAVEIEAAVRRAAEPSPHPWLGEPDVPLLVTAGRLVAKKDHVTLLEAFARVRATRPARLIVFGEGPMRRTLEQQVARLGLGRDVALPGHVDNPFAAMARADLFVLSSISEGMPSVLIEALACGTPVVSTDCPSGPSEILEGGKFGELTPVGDAGALAEAIGRALDRPREPEVLRLRAAHFSLPSITLRYADLLEQVAAEGVPRRRDR